MWNSVMEFIMHSVGLQKSWLKRYSDGRERSEPLLLKAPLYAAANLQFRDVRLTQMPGSTGSVCLDCTRWQISLSTYERGLIRFFSCLHDHVTIPMCATWGGKKKKNQHWVTRTMYREGSHHLRSMTIMHWCQYFIHLYINSFLFIFKQYWNPGADFRNFHESGHIFQLLLVFLAALRQSHLKRGP